MAKTKADLEKERLEQEESNTTDPTSKEEEDLNVSNLVDQLMISYPAVPRGTIYEATMSINNEAFLANYLADQQNSHVYTERELTLGDLFLKNDPTELNAVLDLGGKIGLSKSVTVMAAAFLGVGKTAYNIFTNDDIRQKLDDIDLNHSKKLIEKANALTNKSDAQTTNVADNNNINNNKEGK